MAPVINRKMPWNMKVLQANHCFTVTINTITTKPNPLFRNNFRTILFSTI